MKAFAGMEHTEKELLKIEICEFTFSERIGGSHEHVLGEDKEAEERKARGSYATNAART